MAKDYTVTTPYMSRNFSRQKTQSFRTLEKFRVVFPMVGKNEVRVSKVWNGFFPESAAIEFFTTGLITTSREWFMIGRWMLKCELR